MARITDAEFPVIFDHELFQKKFDAIVYNVNKAVFSRVTELLAEEHQVLLPHEHCPHGRLVFGGVREGRRK